MTFRLGSGSDSEYVKWTPKSSGIELREEAERLLWAAPLLRCPDPGDRSQAPDVELRPGELLVVADGTPPGAVWAHPFDLSAVGTAHQGVVVKRAQRHRPSEDLSEMGLRLSNERLDGICRVKLWEPQPEASFFAGLEHERVGVAFWGASAGVHRAPQGQLLEHGVDQTQHRLVIKAQHPDDYRAASIRLRLLTFGSGVAGYANCGHVVFVRSGDRAGQDSGR